MSAKKAHAWFGTSQSEKADPEKLTRIDFVMVAAHRDAAWASAHAGSFVDWWPEYVKEHVEAEEEKYRAAAEWSWQDARKRR